MSSDVQVDEILSTMRNDITSVETNLEKSKAKVAMDTDNAPFFADFCGWEDDGKNMEKPLEKDSKKMVRSHEWMMFWIIFIH